MRAATFVVCLASAWLGGCLAHAPAEVAVGRWGDEHLDAMGSDEELAFVRGKTCHLQEGVPGSRGQLSWVPLESEPLAGQVFTIQARHALRSSGVEQSSALILDLRDAKGRLRRVRNVPQPSRSLVSEAWSCAVPGATLASLAPRLRGKRLRFNPRSATCHLLDVVKGDPETLLFDTFEVTSATPTFFPETREVAVVVALRGSGGEVSLLSPGVNACFTEAKGSGADVSEARSFLQWASGQPEASAPPPISAETFEQLVGFSTARCLSEGSPGARLQSCARPVALLRPAGEGAQGSRRLALVRERLSDEVFLYEGKLVAAPEVVDLDAIVQLGKVSPLLAQPTLETALRAPLPERGRKFRMFSPSEVEGLALSAERYELQVSLPPTPLVTVTEKRTRTQDGQAVSYETRVLRRSGSASLELRRLDRRGAVVSKRAVTVPFAVEDADSPSSTSPARPAHQAVAPDAAAAERAAALAIAARVNELLSEFSMQRKGGLGDVPVTRGSRAWSHAVAREAASHHPVRLLSDVLENRPTITSRPLVRYALPISRDSARRCFTFVASGLSSSADLNLQLGPATKGKLRPLGRDRRTASDASFELCYLPAGDYQLAVSWGTEHRGPRDFVLSVFESTPDLPDDPAQASLRSSAPRQPKNGEIIVLDEKGSAP